MRSLFILIISLGVISAGLIKPDEKHTKIRYDNYKVYKLFINDESQQSIIKFIQDTPDKYNLWKDYDDVSKEVHIMVKPTETKNFVKLLSVYNIKSEILINNVQELIDLEVQDVDGFSDGSDFGWTRYYKLSEIESWLDHILTTYQTVASGFLIGKSYEGRNIRGIKISYKEGNPGIFIESNIHAREWITSASVTWFINELLTSKDPQVRQLAENYDWFIIPILNVDGFVYSHERDRMWRKTRQPVASSPCIGTDGNRNFDSHWMENNGASNNPCSELYAGPKPFSEPEMSALANYVTSIKDRIQLYISFHSYGQYLLSPYGHNKTEFPENYDHLLEIGKAFSESIASLQYDTQYTYGSTASTLYVASGSSVDWVFNTLDVKVGFTIEFRDKGYWGFILPPIQIIPNCEELMAGMLSLVAKTKELEYL